MKKLHLKLVALLLCVMPVLVWGAETPILDNLTFIKDAYNLALSATQNVCKSLISKSYGAISTIFNTVIATLIGLIAFFWLYKQLKNGGSIGKEEAFKALNFVIIFIIVYVLLNSSKAFNEFTNLFLIPQKIVSSALSTGGGNVAQQLNDAFVMPYKTYYNAKEAGYHLIVKSFDPFLKLTGIPQLAAFYGSNMGLIVYIFYLAFFIILVIAIIIIHLYSSFLSSIYIMFLPIMIPLLLIPQTKGMFFAWVKSFIGITMYIPLSMIPVSIATRINSLMTSNGQEIWQNTMHYSFLGLVFVIISFLILYKMPTWISELLGVANQGVGAGGAIGMLKTAGKGVGAWGKAAMSNITSADSGKGALAKAGLNLATAGTYGAVAEGAKKLTSLIKNGFKSTGMHTGKK